MSDTPPAGETAAPVPAPSPEQVTIALGPDLAIYDPGLLPATPAPPEKPTTPEAAEPAVTPSEPTLAGPEPPEPPQQGDVGQEQGTRKQRGQEAYERGLAEGRAEAERQRAQAEARQKAESDAQEATSRVENLFRALESTDPSQQAWARQGILSLYRGNQQASAIQNTTRQQILQQMAEDFGKLRGADGIDDAAYDQLHSAGTPVELVQRALALGRRSRDDDVARLEAELTQLRGRLVGQTATPQPANGISGGGGLGITYEQYLNMSPAEARKLTPRQIDAIVAEHARELQASANGHP